MSTEIFPSLPGLRWEQKKTPIFSTRVQRSVSGREMRVPLFTYPLYQYDLSYELLRDKATSELAQLAGFYLKRQGAFDSFLYLDPSDYIVTGQPIGIGDGVTRSFQLGRTYGGFFEPRWAIAMPGVPTPVVNIYLDGVHQIGGYIIIYDFGTLLFAVAPALHTVITADFTYYQVARFVEYTEDGSPGGGGSAFNQFMYKLWELQSLSFITCRRRAGGVQIGPG